MKKALLGTILILMIVTGFIIGMKLVQQEKAHTQNCNYINETSEYTVDDLNEAGCFDNLDFINQL